LVGKLFYLTYQSQLALGFASEGQVEMTDKVDQWIWFKNKNGRTCKIKLKTLLTRVSNSNINYYATRRETNGTTKRRTSRSNKSEQS
jgi:hypothetical protein